MSKKEKIGQIVSTKMNNTVVVEVEAHKAHPRYKKIICTSKKYKAHNEELDCVVGDQVKMVEHKPISKSKLWKVVEITKKAN